MMLLMTALEIELSSSGNSFPKPVIFKRGGEGAGCANGGLGAEGVCIMMVRGGLQFPPYATSHQYLLSPEVILFIISHYVCTNEEKFAPVSSAHSK